MVPPIQNFAEEYKRLNSFLLEHGEYSLAIDVNHHFRKIYLLSCASFYEMQITEIIKNFVEVNSKDERVVAFTNFKAIERQYHTYFDWKQTKNINSFLGLFGSTFKTAVSEEIKANELLSLQVEAFLILGRERNLMVHENFLEYQLEKTFDELVILNNRATLFIEFIRNKFALIC